MILALPMGYDTPIGPGGAHLSGGERQQIALVRAIYGDPAFVVLDEPNANLDREGEVDLLRALQTLSAEGVTLVVISHRPNVMHAVRNLLVLRDGQVAAFGPRDSVLQPQPCVTHTKAAAE